MAVWTVQKTYPFLALWQQLFSSFARSQFWAPKATFCRTPMALRFFWRVRPSTYRHGLRRNSGSGGLRPRLVSLLCLKAKVAFSDAREGYSYLPNGCCCSLRRKHFQYHGDQAGGVDFCEELRPSCSSWLPAPAALLLTGLQFTAPWPRHLAG